MTPEKKLYYTDPLAAAYMAREFGVKFTTTQKQRVKRGVPARYTHIKKKVELSNPWSIACSSYKNKKLFIHPDSYYIFEAQLDDIEQATDCVINPEMCINKVVEDEVPHKMYPYSVIHQTPANLMLKEGVGQIIQRNNKPFFWPESEEL